MKKLALLVAMLPLLFGFADSGGVGEGGLNGFVPSGGSGPPGGGIALVIGPLGILAPGDPL